VLQLCYSMPSDTLIWVLRGTLIKRTLLLNIPAPYISFCWNQHKITALNSSFAATHMWCLMNGVWCYLAMDMSTTYLSFQISNFRALCYNVISKMAVVLSTYANLHWAVAGNGCTLSRKWTYRLWHPEHHLWKHFNPVMVKNGTNAEQLKLNP
jgi:hypothetical protein